MNNEKTCYDLIVETLQCYKGFLAKDRIVHDLAEVDRESQYPMNQELKRYYYSLDDKILDMAKLTKTDDDFDNVLFNRRKKLL